MVAVPATTILKRMTNTLILLFTKTIIPKSARMIRVTTLSICANSQEECPLMSIIFTRKSSLISRRITNRRLATNRRINTGYKGRIGIYEIMTITPKIKSLISKGVDIEDINKAACDEGMHTLRQSAEKLVLEGVTSFQEMLKTTFEN